MKEESYFITDTDGAVYFVYVDPKTGEETYCISEDPDDLEYYC